MKRDFTIKKFAILLLVLVVLFIPTYIAIGNYYNNKNKGPAVGENAVLRVCDPKNREYEIRPSDTERWNLFHDMIQNGQSVAAIPDSVNRDENMLLARYITETRDPEGVDSSAVISTEEKQYAFYFTTDKSNCYLMDPDKRIYRISENDVNAFLADEEISAFLYRTSEIPSVSVLGYKVSPTATHWNYLTAGNTYQPVNDTLSEHISVPYTSGADFPITFSKAPDRCTVRIVSSAGVLYDASYTNLLPISSKVNTPLTVTMEAEWLKDNNREGYGVLEYSFTAELCAAPAFKISTSKMALGDIAVISAINVSDPAAVTFSSTPALPYTPVFYPSGDGVVSALIPISYRCSKGNYTLLVSYGKESASFTVSVSDYKYGYSDRDYSVAQSIVDNYYSKSQVENSNVLIGEICKGPSNGVLFSGKFLDYQAKNVLDPLGAVNVQGFARNIIVNKKNDLSFEHTGVDVEMKTKTELKVPAMNRGVVAYVGNDSVLGKFVVVDHGCGLRSWYAHLTETSVKTGDAVDKGEALGSVTASKTTGFTAPGRIHVGFSVGSEWVAPYGLWEKGLVFPDFTDITG